MLIGPSEYTTLVDREDDWVRGDSFASLDNNLANIVRNHASRILQYLNVPDVTQQRMSLSLREFAPTQSAGRTIRSYPATGEQPSVNI